MRLQFFAEGKDGDCCCHLRLYRQSHVQDQLLAFLHSARLQHQLLVLVRACSEVAQSRYGMALDLVVLGRTEKVDQGTEEAGFDNGRFVRGVNGNVSYTCNGGEDKREVRRLQKAEERRQTTCADNVELVAFV